MVVIRRQFRDVFLSVILLLAAGTGRVAGAVFESAPVTNSGGFYFAQITDTHWGVKGGVALTRRAVQAINKLPVEIAFVVHTGDILADTIHDEALVREGVEVMRGLKAPVYYIPGNHDILEGGKKATERLFADYFGGSGRKVEIKGVWCLFMSSEWRDGDERRPSHGQQDWIARMVRKDDARPVLVFLHRPPVADRLNAKTPEEWGEEKHPRWERLFEERPQIKALVAGHLHRDELHWIGGVPVYVASSVASFWERQSSVRLYHYDGGRLTYWTIYP